MKLSELTSKDVICNSDGTKIGKVSDLEINEITGAIKSLYITKGLRILSAFTKDQMEVPWSKITKIGSDVIIVSENFKKTKEQKS